MNHSEEMADIGLVDLGAASLETRGLPQGTLDDEGKLRQMSGLSDD